MKFIFLILLFISTFACSKPKSVLICGDHVCINNAEAELYFEQNLSIEVKIIDKKIKDEINLVELNLIKNQRGKKEIRVSLKETTSDSIKTLSSNEISKIKKDLKNNKENKKISKKVIYEEKKKLNKNTTDKIVKKNVYKKKELGVDVCTILVKCSIDEISKYLIEMGKKKKFPDITVRQ